MINFRFHIASLIAVFLALALGIVIGSTVIDRAIVEGLENRIDRVENNAEKRQKENRELESRLDELNAYTKTASRYVVAGRLTGVGVSVTALRGADKGQITSVVQTLRDAGAIAPEILWVEKRASLEKRADVRPLAEIVGGNASNRDEVFANFATVLSAIARGNTAKSAALSDAGFITIEAIDGQVSQSVAARRALFVVGVESDPKLLKRSSTITSAFVSQNLPTVIAESNQGDHRNDALDEAVGTNASAVSTVNDLDGSAGPTAVVIAMADLGRGVIGHFGVGENATPLPEFSG